MLEGVRGGILQAGRTGGDSRSTMVQNALPGCRSPDRKPSVEDDEAVKSPGASSWRILSARLKSWG